MIKVEALGLRIQLSGTGVQEVRNADRSRPEAKEWDRFVEAAPGGDLVQTTAWAGTKRALGFETCLVLVRERETVVGGGHIIIKRFGPFGGIGYIARGPLIASGFSERIPDVLDEIERVARARRWRHLIVQPPEGGFDVAAQLARRKYVQGAPEVAPTATLRIDLSQGLDQILAGMSARRRGEVRRIERSDVEIRIGGPLEIEAFHRLHEGTARRQGFTALSLSWLRHQWDILYPIRGVQMFLAYHQERLLAGIWATSFGKTLTYRLQGWKGEEAHLRPNVACHWSAIQWAKEQGYRYYDFGGIDYRYAELLGSGRPIPKTLLQSPAAFKVRFGGKPVLLPVASQTTFNPVAGLIVRSMYRNKRSSEAVRKILNRVRNG